MRTTLVAVALCCALPAQTARADHPAKASAANAKAHPAATTTTAAITLPTLPTGRVDLWDQYTAAKKGNVEKDEADVATAAGFPSVAVMETWEREAQQAHDQRAKSERNDGGAGGLVGLVTDAPSAHITSDYGMRVDPMSDSLSTHSGVDIGAPYGAKIFAVADGVVTKAAYDDGYGFMIEIQHNNGMSTRYCHASGLNVERGMHVVAGQKIATVGSTGRSTGSHVHFEVRNRRAIPVDPHDLVRKHLFDASAE